MKLNTPKNSNLLWIPSQNSIYFLLGIFLIYALGFFLRLYQIQQQVLLDDEWHGLLFAVRKNFWQIIGGSSLGATSALSNLYYWVLLRLVGWSETLIRLPQILSGLGALLIFPFFLRQQFNRRVTLIASYLFAISPLLVFYTRYSRPYSIVILLGIAALSFLYAWSQSSKKCYARLYIFCSVVAIWANPASLITVVTPLIVVAGIKFFQQRKPSFFSEFNILPGFEKILLLGFNVFCFILLYYTLIFIKNPWYWKVTNQYPESADFQTLAGAVSLLVGTNYLSLTLLFLALFLIGIRVIHQKYPTLGVIFLSVFIGYAFCFSLVAMQMMGSSIVVARYMIVGIPIGLTCIAVALDECLSRWSHFVKRSLFGSPIVISSALVTFLGAYLWTGPLVNLYRETPNNFMNHAAFQYSYRPMDWNWSYDSYIIGGSSMKKEEIPNFYFQLKNQEFVKAIIEYPMPVGNYFNLYYYYQHFHEKRVFVGYHPKLPINPNRPYQYVFGSEVIDRIFSRFRHSWKLNFHNLVNMFDVDAVKNSGASYIILHKHIIREMVPSRRDLVGKVYGPTYQLKAIYEKEFGDPIYEDQHIFVYAISPLVK